MNKAEENVYSKDIRTGEVAEASEKIARDWRKDEEKAPTVPNKFKDVDALARAYQALEAEFTKRSQRLKELEARAENFSFENDKSGTGRSGAEKLRRNAALRREEAKEFEEFLTEVENSNDGAERKEKPEETVLKTPETERVAENAGDIKNVETGIVETAENVADEKELAKAETTPKETQGALQTERVEKLLTGTGTSVAEVEGAKNTVEDLYVRARENEEVRLRIIGEYLSSIGKAGAPLTVGSVGTIAAPPIRAKSIGEAGGMALRYFKTVTKE